MSNTARKQDELELLRQDYYFLREYLMQQKGWVTQNTITHYTGMKGTRVREICNAFPRLAIGSTEGYILAQYASKAQIQHAVSTLIGRSNKMLTRAQALSELLVR